MLCWGVVSFVPVVVLGFVREKNRPARLVGDTNGTKFALCVQNARNRVILGEQGEFYPGSGGVWLVLVEFVAYRVATAVAGRRRQKLCGARYRAVVCEKVPLGPAAHEPSAPRASLGAPARSPPVPSGPSDDLQAASLGDMPLALWGSSSG